MEDDENKVGATTDQRWQPELVASVRDGWKFWRVMTIHRERSFSGQREHDLFVINFGYHRVKLWGSEMPIVIADMTEAIRRMLPGLRLRGGKNGGACPVPTWAYERLLEAMKKAIEEPQVTEFAGAYR